MNTKSTTVRIAGASKFRRKFRSTRAFRVKVTKTENKRGIPISALFDRVIPMAIPKKKRWAAGGLLLSRK
jgi:hypothetical protein